MKPSFGAVVTAMVTPFDDEGNLDLDAAADLARWLVAKGSDGLVLAGTTGEAPVLADAEKLDLFRAVREAVEVPLLAGTGSNDTAHSIQLTRRATDCGVDGILVVTPYYNRPGPAGLEAHFREVAAATPLPVLIYDIPVRTGRKVPPELLLRLVAEVPNIVGVKDAAGDPAGSAALLAAAEPAGTPLELYSGDDSLTLPLASIGAVGVIGVATHWAGPQHAEMLSCFGAGDVQRAREINATLIESYEFETGPEWPNPIPAKAMMRALGLRVGQCRPPMGSAPAELEQRARVVYRNLTGG